MSSGFFKLKIHQSELGFNPWPLGPLTNTSPVCHSDQIIIIIIIRVFCLSAGTYVALLPKAGLSPQTQEPRLQFQQELNVYGSFPLLSTPHSLFSIWTNLKISEEWIWLTGPSRLHRNSPQGLNISCMRVLTRSEIQKSLSTFTPPQIR